MSAQGVCPTCGAEVLLSQDHRVTAHRQAIMRGGEVARLGQCAGVGRPADVDVSHVDRVVGVLAESRVAQDLTVAELAKVAGVERETVARMERGLSVPSLRILRLVATALGCDITVGPRR